MSRKYLAIVAIIMSPLIGCGGQKPVAVPVSDPASATQVEVPAATPATAAISKTTPSKTTPAESASAAAANRPRELISRYLESDGQGGWRKNEKAATDLEKLTAEEIAQLWPMLKDQQVEVRRAAAVFLLGLLDSESNEQVAAFTVLLKDSDSMVRARGLDAVRQFAAADQIAALPQLTALLDASREERPENRAAAARLCGALKRDAASAAGALQSAARDSDPKVRSAALAALVQVADPPLFLASLGTALTDSDPSVRIVAAARLRQVGPAAAPVAHVLAEALADSSKDVAEAAAESLIRIGPPAVEPLAVQLASTNIPARKLALACLAKLGQVAKPAMTRIEKCKQDADPEVRQLAEAALKRISPQ